MGFGVRLGFDGRCSRFNEFAGDSLAIDRLFVVAATATTPATLWDYGRIGVKPPPMPVAFRVFIRMAGAIIVIPASPHEVDESDAKEKKSGNG